MILRFPFIKKTPRMIAQRISCISHNVRLICKTHARTRTCWITHIMRYIFWSCDTTERKNGYSSGITLESFVNRSAETYIIHYTYTVIKYLWMSWHYVRPLDCLLYLSNALHCFFRWLHYSLIFSDNNQFLILLCVIQQQRLAWKK